MSAALSYEGLAWLVGVYLLIGIGLGGLIAETAIRRLGFRLEILKHRIGWIAECVDPKSRWTPDPDEPEAWDWHCERGQSPIEFWAGRALFLDGIRLNILRVCAVSAESGCVLFDNGTLACGDVLILPADAILQEAGE